MSDDIAQAERDDIVQAVADLGLLRRGQRISPVALGGGVSCDVYRVDLESGPVCVKRALPRLRVKDEWIAPAERAASEVAWFRLVSRIDPASVPRVLAEDRRRHLFVMEYLPPQTHPVWKTELARGIVDSDFASKVGTMLARIHAATAGLPDIAALFSNSAQFHTLRIEPYLLFTAEKHPDVATAIRRMASEIEGARIALMHGDVSPKNILCGPEGPVFLDAETTCYGDPAFDLAFCLNHLLLKCVWHPGWTAAYLSAFKALKESYFARASWEDTSALEARTARLLPALLLARIDGKSPVEYLTREGDRSFVRQNALALLAERGGDLDVLRAQWNCAMAAKGKT